MKKKAKLIGYIVGIVLFIVMIAGVSYAMYRKSLYNFNISGEIKNLDEYVIYSKGVNISSGTLNPVSSYSNGTSATITFYKNSNTPYDIYGHIYLDINSMTMSLSRELKYTVLDNSTSNIISEGSFNKFTSGSSLLTACNIPLNTTETTYTVYVWLDEELYDSSTANSSFDIDIRCYATMNTIQNPGVNPITDYQYTLYPKSETNLDEDYVLLVKYIGTSKTVIIPDYYDIDGVTYRTVFDIPSPPNGVFYGNTLIEQVLLPSSVLSFVLSNSIPILVENNRMSNMFKSCTSLVWISEIPSTIKYLSDTFSICTSLVNAPEIPNSVTDMNFTFAGCTSLVNAPEIPNSVTNMSGTFYNCTNLTGTVTINSSNVTYTSGLQPFYGTVLPITVEVPEGSTTYTKLNNDKTDNMTVTTFTP